MMSDSTKRFTGLVDKYMKFRPTYPADVISFLATEAGLHEGSAVADIGSGTGIFTGLLLQQGYKVFAVEPNEDMQQAAKKQYGGNAGFTPVDGAAEATTLPTKSMDLIVCAQSFHWFNDGRTHMEFNRIIKDSGYVALIWNNRQTDNDEFATAYDLLLRNNSVDYNNVNHRNIKDIDFKAFFKDSEYQLVKFPNEQVFDEEGMMGRVFSSSYVPRENTPDGERFKSLLKEIFNKYNNGGQVGFKYQTEIYFGKV